MRSGCEPKGRPVLRVIESPTLAPYERRWDELVNRGPLPTPFLRSGWLHAVAGTDAACLLVLDGAELVGGLPLVRSRAGPVEVYRFLGNRLGAVDMDLVAARGRALEVRIALREWARTSGALLFDLDGTRDGSWVAALLLNAVMTPRPPVPVLDLARLPRGSGGREAIGRRWRAGRDSLDSALDLFAQLATADDQLPPALRRAVTAAHAVDEAWIDVQEQGGEPAAVLICFVLADRVFAYRLARSRNPRLRGGGADLLGEVLAGAAAEGCTAAELGPGVEPLGGIQAEYARHTWRVRLAHGLSAQVALAVARGHREITRRLELAGPRFRRDRHPL
jgi:hypothetical protein